MFESVTLFWSGAVTVVSVVFAGILKWFTFYTSSFVPRKLDLYDRLKASAPDDSEVKSVLSIAAEEEIFKIVFSQGGTPEYRKALIALYQSGRFSLRDLQLSKACLEVGRTTNSTKRIIGKFGIFEKISLFLLSISLIFAFIFFSSLFTNFLALKSQQGVMAALVSLLFLFLTVFTVGSEVVRLFVSFRVCKKLEEYAAKNVPEEGNSENA